MAMVPRQVSPPNGLHHYQQPGGHAQLNGHGPGQPIQKITPQTIATGNEAMWISIGNIAEMQNNLDMSIEAYEQALRHNQYSLPAMQKISEILRTKENFPRAVEYLQMMLKIDQQNGETWGSLGHCYLMLEDLQQAYTAYQQALYYLRDPKEPKLWYGIGILYDRYGSLEHAEEAFSQVMRMEPGFEKANEIYFRLGIIYKQQQKFGQSLECFQYIVQDPPRPLTEEDIWFQIGHVYEQQKDYESAKSAYRRVLERDPNHAKVLQQLGWLHHQQSTSFQSQDEAIEYLEKSVNSDNTDAQSWYLLGRCYMSQQKYNKAYEAYQQAVYRDGRNPTFWCSIGVLYYQINQYRDALDAYSRAIRLNPYISEVWYDLGTLYESCANQTNDALDAYQRAADLDPTNSHIKARLQLLRSQQATGIPAAHSAPIPQDVHPQQYQAPGVGAPPGHQWSIQGSVQPTPAAQVPAPPGPPGEWQNRRLAAIDNPQPQPPNGFDQRDVPRPPMQPRPLSPRQQDHMRFQEQHRQEQPRRVSPPRGPGPMPNAPASFPGPQALPHPGPLQPQQQPPAPTRINNPNYGAPNPQLAPPSNIGPPPPVQGPMPPMGRGNSPPPEIRPILDDRKPSPGGHYSGPQYNQHQGYQEPAMMSGQKPPIAALAAAEASAARERDDRPPVTGYKRTVEPEDDYKIANKKPANGDIRGRTEEHQYRRDSPDRRPASPLRPRTSSSETRREEQRRADANAANYHPSEAAHHPQPMPPVQHQPQHLPQQLPPPPPAPQPAQQQALQQQVQAAQHQALQQPPQPSPQPLTIGPLPPPPPPQQQQQQAPQPPPQPSPQPQQIHYPQHAPTPPLNHPSVPEVRKSIPPPAEAAPAPTPAPAATPTSAASEPLKEIQRPQEQYEPAARKMDVDEDYDDDGDEPAKAAPAAVATSASNGTGAAKVEPIGN